MMGLYYCKLKIQVKNYFICLADFLSFGFLRRHFDQMVLESRRSWEVMWEIGTLCKASYIMFNHHGVCNIELKVLLG